MAGKSTFIKVNITGDARLLKASLGEAATAGQVFQARMAGLSAGLTKLALPIAVAGGASVKMAVDFDKSMTKIQSLVGISKDKVDAMRSSVLSLAGETGRAPKELADALFFITSAGLRGADAMDALKASAEASAVGMGDMASIADALTSAMNAYGPEVLSASAATDVLVAAVREGKLDAESLAGSLGKVIPVASQMGVSFDQVGAALAAMSRIGIDADTGTTALRQVMISLLKPTSEAEATLREFGTSSEELRRKIKDEGLLSVLLDLQNRFGDNDTAMSKVFGNARSLTGVLGLVGANAEDTQRIFDVLAGSTGDLAKAFAETSESDAFKLEQALGKLKAAAIKLGSEATPAIETMASAVGNLASAFGSMGDGAQKATVNTGLFVVGAAAVARIVKGLAGIVLGATGAFATFKGSMIGTWIGVKAIELGGLSAALGAVSAAALPLGLIALPLLAAALDDGEGHGSGMEVRMRALAGEFETVGEMAAAMGAGVEEGAKNFSRHSENMGSRFSETASSVGADVNRMAGFLVGTPNSLTARMGELNVVARAQFGELQTTFGELKANAETNLGGVVDAFTKAPEQIDISLKELEQNLADDMERQKEFALGLATLYRMGLDDTAAMFEEKGDEFVGALSEFITQPVEDQLRFEQGLENATLFGDQIGPTVIAAAASGLGDMIEYFSGYGRDLAKAVERGFRAAAIDLTVDAPGRVGGTSPILVDARAD